MKQGIRIFTLIFSLCFVSVVSAKPPVCDDPGNPPGKPDKPTKVAILHCGCAFDGGAMQYEEITISSKSKGHSQHVAGSIASCSDGSDSYQDFVRSGSDCQVDNGAESWGSMEFCENKVAMDACGTEVID